MSTAFRSPSSTIFRDLNAGMVVFLVAIPLCLGIALASNAPLLSGVLSGIVGGILVGVISRSQTSVSGPAAALAAIVAAQISALGSFAALQMAIIVAGVIQVGLGLARAGAISAFFPSSVVKGLLAAIGILLVLKQIPHLLGHDADPQGEMSFHQPDNANTFSELSHMFGHIHLGSATIGVVSIVLMALFQVFKPLKNSRVPAPLVVVLSGIFLSLLFQKLGGIWLVEPSNFVQVPIVKGPTGFLDFLQLPDFSQCLNPKMYSAGLTIAIAASLGTLLNLESVDKLDPLQRTSPPNRELVAQGIGNMAVGLIGGIPITSEIVRSTVNVNAGARTEFSTVVHGMLLLISVVMFPRLLSMIPLSCLAAILLVTGAKLVSPKMLIQTWSAGRYHLIPFALTVIAIVFTDLLMGVLIGLAASLAFVLNSNLRRPIRRSLEKHLGGEVLHVELANQVSFLNRAALSKVIDAVAPGGNVLLNAENADYIDPDILDLIRDFKEKKAPARGVKVSLVGFKSKYQLQDQVRYVDYSTRELQNQISPRQVLQLIQAGHERFRTGQQLTRDFGRQVKATAAGQHPLAVVLSCIDSRTPAELIFDLGVGDIFSVRVAGNILSPVIIGSIEYACHVAGAKLILIMGHSRCGAITAAVDRAFSPGTDGGENNCQHIDSIMQAIQPSIEPFLLQGIEISSPNAKDDLIGCVSRANVIRVAQLLRSESGIVAALEKQGKLSVAGAFYDVTSGSLEFLPVSDENLF